jgi:MYXO-CTERM domain-containing protein
MRRAVATLGTAVLLLVPGTAAFADDAAKNAQAQTQTETQDDGDQGLWGMAGLLGLAGLAGLMRRGERAEGGSRYRRAA